MDIQETYLVKYKDLQIEYKMIGYDEELDRAFLQDEIKEDKTLSAREKLDKTYQLMIDDLVSIKGLKKGDKEVTIEDIRNKKVPLLIMQSLLRIYSNHKKELVNELMGNEATQG